MSANRLTTPINTTKIAKTLSVSSRNIGELCDSSKVNKWSFWKPVHYPSIEGITDEILYWLDGGYNITSSQNVDEAMLNVSNGQTWEYIKPEGDGMSPYRAGDFRNYDHEQDNWFDLTVIGNDNDNDVTVGLGANIPFGFAYNKPSRIEFITDMLFKFRTFMEQIHSKTFGPNGDGTMPESFVEALNGTQQKQSSLTFALLFKQRGLLEGSNTLMYKVFDALNSGDGDGELLIKIPENGQAGNSTISGTYEVYPCLTTYTDSNDFNKFFVLDKENGNYTWWVFPTTRPLTITVDTGAQPEAAIDVEVVDVTFVNNTGNWNGTVIENISQIYCTVNNNSPEHSYSGSITLYFKDEMTGNKTFTGSFTNITPEGSQNVILWNGKDETIRLEFPETNIEVNVSEQITHKDGNKLTTTVYGSSILQGEPIITMTQTDPDK